MYNERSVEAVLALVECDASAKLQNVSDIGDAMHGPLEELKVLNLPFFMAL